MIGEKLGKYTILEELGAGSMGTVYKAEDPAEGRLVAIKLVRSQVLYDTEKRERFLQALLAVCETRHPGICPILEIGDDNDDFFVVMPFLEGKPLSGYMAGSPLPWREALDISVRAGEAVAAGHAAGAVHRGLKPANVWILKGGNVLVSDFGIARFTEIARGGRISSRKGKPDFAEMIIPMGALGYMSPEQVRGSAVDHRSDIFSFGAMLYQMLTGIHPFEARNSLSRMHAILEGQPAPVGSRGALLPSELNPILDRALAKSPEERYQRMGDLLEALHAVRAHGRAPEPPPGRGRVADQKPFLLRPWILALLAALVALIAFLVLQWKSG